MPVTARLSRKFYERLGDDVANELVEWFNLVDSTYRNDLRELNEFNFARSDAKLEQRLADLSSGLRTELTVALANQKSELVRWMVGLWATQVIALVGVVLAVLMRT